MIVDVENLLKDDCWCWKSAKGINDRQLPNSKELQPLYINEESNTRKGKESEYNRVI